MVSGVVSFLSNAEMSCEITGYHSGAAEDSSLLARNDVSFGE
jgi:hypothetical protein